VGADFHAARGVIEQVDPYRRAIALLRGHAEYLASTFSVAWTDRSDGAGDLRDEALERSEHLRP
jgi:hypothetical protein